MNNINTNGAPDKTTEGVIGDICTDTVSGRKYVLDLIIHLKSYKKIETQYIWKPITNEDTAPQTLIDIETGASYTLEVSNGKLTLKEA